MVFCSTQSCSAMCALSMVASSTWKTEVWLWESWWSKSAWEVQGSIAPWWWPQKLRSGEPLTMEVQCAQAEAETGIMINTVWNYDSSHVSQHRSALLLVPRKHPPTFINDLNTNSAVPQQPTWSLRQPQLTHTVGNTYTVDTQARGTVLLHPAFWAMFSLKYIILLKYRSFLFL